MSDPPSTLPSPFTLQQLIRSRSSIGEPSPRALKRAKERAERKSQRLSQQNDAPSTTPILVEQPLLQDTNTDEPEQENALQIVNGEIVFTDLQPPPKRSRRGSYAMEVDLPDYEEPAINSASFGKKKTRVRWKNDDDLLFYKGLKLFKTNFTLIGALFPDKTRKELSIKYNYELKKDFKSVQAALQYEPNERDTRDMEEVLEVIRTKGWSGIEAAKPKDVEYELEEEKYWDGDGEVKDAKGEVGLQSEREDLDEGEKEEGRDEWEEVRNEVRNVATFEEHEDYD
ncbi:hypothetical protein P9112_008192 [Eukaryota sp. TZLM1-RC]